MAFAAARMIMPKDKQGRKASAELPANTKNRSKVSENFISGDQSNELLQSL